jgi:NAD(P)-dependent dehydrogenase (short-subunit alcohol dehydrogenase family)
MAAYCASKSALEALSESLRLEEARHGIQVLVARPDLTKTPMNSGAGAVHSAAEAAARIVKAMKKRRRVVNGTWRAALLVLIAAPLAPLLDFVMKWTYRRRLK